MGDPNTIGVIPDGNRRYARKAGIPHHEGYIRGIKKAERFMDYVVEHTETRNVYFYTLSLENLNKRSKSELSFLFKVFEKEAVRTLVDNRWNAEIQFIGRICELPKNIQKAIDELEKKTDGNGGPTIVLAMAYTGMAEIVDMVKKIAGNVKSGAINIEDIVEKKVYDNLYAPEVPPPDAIIRTSGECRLSGFLPIQSVYSELLFYPKLWPELEREDLDRIYGELRSRERRFGG